jgi:hypothetical protein
MKNAGAQNPRGIAAAAPSPVEGVVSDPEVAQLEALLEQLLVEHEELLTLAASHRQAIAGADPHTLGACLERQGEVARRVADLEGQRLALVARLADKMRPLAALNGGKGSEPVPDRPTVSWIAKSLPEPMRSRLVALAERLRALLARLQREHATLREASAALASHMEGMMRQLAKRLSHAGTYGRRGTVETRVQVVSALDLRT